MIRASLTALLALTLALAPGCKKSGAPTPSPPSPSSPSSPSPSSSGGESPGTPPGCTPPEPGQPMTSDQCTCLGGRVNASIGGGEQEHCTAGETELGTVRIGIEGGWCCKAH